MTFPVTQTHPTKIMFTIVTLHMITTAILFNANVTIGTVFCVSTYVIGRFAVVRTFGEPTLNHLAVGRCMIVSAAFKTKRRIA